MDVDTQDTQTQDDRILIGIQESFMVVCVDPGMPRRIPYICGCTQTNRDTSGINNFNGGDLLFFRYFIPQESLDVQVVPLYSTGMNSFYSNNCSTLVRSIGTCLLFLFKQWFYFSALLFCFYSISCLCQIIDLASGLYWEQCPRLSPRTLFTNKVLNLGNDLNLRF